jgi:DNA repair protein RecN (Recombination protein N)
VLRRRVEIAHELDTLEAFDDRVLELERAAKSARSAAEQAAARLREARRRVAKRVEGRIETELADLGMKSARFSASIAPAGTLGPHGSDQIEFLLSSNLGETPMPMAKIASGGELSRIMLALKHVLAEAETVELYVFDEVDTGVSGAVGERIGLKLFETARQRQALCITHLPQVACHADTHLLVHKDVEGGRTVTRVDRLDDLGRQEELARLLAGVEVTAVARAHALELLTRAKSVH